MAILTWLHLSDIHFRDSESYNTSVVLRSLLEDLRARIKKEGLAPDLIFMTGDVAFSGKTTEYELAERFFDDLLKVTGLSKQRLFIVPGNHDVDRSAITPLAGVASSLLDNREAVGRFLNTQDDRTLIFKRFRHYQQFIQRYFEGLIPFDDQQFFYTRTIEVGGYPIAVMGLNSTWLAGSDQDLGKLVLGEQQVRRAVAAAPDAVVRISLMHHPLDWLKEFDRMDVSPLLSRDCHFVLHGHMHDLGLLRADTPDEETMFIAAGACYAHRTYPNSYNIVQLNLAGHTGRIYLRMYSDRAGGFWTKDVVNYRNVPDGVYDFQVPKASLRAAWLVSWLEKAPLDSKLLDEFANLGAEGVDKLKEALQTGFLEASGKPSAAALATPLQRRAFAALSHMTNANAISYLKSLTPEGMCLIPAGSFVMGSEREGNERPPTQVWLPSFYLARYPVKNSDYLQFIQSGGYHHHNLWTEAGWEWVQKHHKQYPWRWSDADKHERRDHPVQWLSWYEAWAYARWMAVSTGAFYRLPSEAEWEKAAGWDENANRKREYPWGDNFDRSRCNLNGVWTVPVTQYSPAGDSLYGVSDLIGNVWQWSSSLRRPYPYAPDVAHEDAAASGQRAFRGGCWANNDFDLARCSKRYYDSQTSWPYMNTDGSYEGPCGLRLALGVTRIMVDQGQV